MKTERRYRLSVFAPGVTDKTACCVKHHACKTSERAESLFARYTKDPTRRVILHQGKLQFAGACRIIRDTHPEPSYTDALTARHTAFATFRDLIDAPGYFPSFNVAKREMLFLAGAYDAAQLARGDGRLAHRYEVKSDAMINTERLIAEAMGGCAS